MGVDGMRSSAGGAYIKPVDSAILTKPEMAKATLTGEKKAGLEKNLETLKKSTITATALLPVSSRGIAFNLVRTPLRVAQNLGSGIVEMAKNKPITVLDKTKVDELKAQLKKDWGGGIDDKYQDLSKLGDGKKIAKENLRYAQYIYVPENELKGKTSANSWEGECLRLEKKNPNDTRPTISEIFRGQLKEMGFQCDGDKFFHEKTGTMFRLVHDSGNKELVISFMGFGNQNMLMGQSETQRNNVKISSGTTILKDFLGGVPEGSLQAIKLGELVKDEAARMIKDGVDYTPVAAGHSHGGGLAQCAAAANGIKGVVFNARPMGAGLRRYIGQEKVANNSKNITAFSVKGDWLSGNSVFNGLAIATERVIGMPVPRSVGTGYELPAKKDENGNSISTLDQHNAFYDQLIEATGETPAG